MICQDGVDFYMGEHSADAFYSFFNKALTTDVIKLTATNFDDLVVKNVGGDVAKPNLWLIDFSAGAWCGPCTNLKSSVRSLSATVKGIVKVGIIDCDGGNSVCQNYQIGYYPQLRFFSPQKLSEEEKKYMGITLEMNQMKMPAQNVLDIFGTLMVEVAKAFNISVSSPQEVLHDEL